MRVAVIGSGASAFGTILGLREAASAEVHLFAADDLRIDDALATRDPRSWSAAERTGLHRRLRRDFGRGFPPPRGLFGASLTQHNAPGEGILWKSDSFGGLSNFWSCWMFPYRAGELDGWPFSYDDILPYYRRIAETVGVSGAHDGLDEAFPGDFVTRPPLRPTGLSNRFLDALSAGPTAMGYRILAGINRMALDTAETSPNHCVYCGGCAYGCFRDAFFRPARHLQRWTEEGFLQSTTAKIDRVRKTGDGYELVSAGARYAGYDKVFLCAGAVGSSILAAQSFDLTNQDILIEDNELFAFLIRHRGKAPAFDADHFAFSNVSMSLLPAGGSRSLHANTSPVPDYLLEYYLPDALRGLARRPIRALQRRALLGAIYGDASTASRYVLRIGDDRRPRIEIARRGAATEQARAGFAAIAAALEGSPFRCVTSSFRQISTSSHYAGGFGRPVGGLSVAPDGRLSDEIYVCDAAGFPETPAQAPTFTIMANAMRIAEGALG